MVSRGTFGHSYNSSIKIWCRHITNGFICLIIVIYSELSRCEGTLKSLFLLTVVIRRARKKSAQSSFTGCISDGFVNVTVYLQAWKMMVFSPWDWLGPLLTSPTFVVYYIWCLRCPFLYGPKVPVHHPDLRVAFPLIPAFAHFSVFEPCTRTDFQFIFVFIGSHR